MEFISTNWPLLLLISVMIVESVAISLAIKKLSDTKDNDDYFDFDDEGK